MDMMYLPNKLRRKYNVPSTIRFENEVFGREVPVLVRFYVVC